MPVFYYNDKTGKQRQITAINKDAAKMQISSRGISFDKFIKNEDERKLTSVVGDVKKKVTDFGYQFLEIKQQAERLKTEEKGKFIDTITNLHTSSHDQIITILGDVGDDISAQREMLEGTDSSSEEDGAELTPEQENAHIAEGVRDSFSMSMARKVLGTGNKLESSAIQKAIAKREKQRENTKNVNCNSVDEYQSFLEKFSNEDNSNKVIITEADRHDSTKQMINNFKMWWARINGREVVVLKAGTKEAEKGMRKLNSKDSDKIEESKGDDSALFKAPTHKKTGNLMTDMNNSVNDFFVSITPVKTKDVVTFYQLLNVMVNAGVPIMKSLQELIRQTKNLHLRQILIDILYAVENGSTFSAALGEYPDIFDDAQRGVIKAGEASGSLGDTLKRLSSDMEKSAKMAAKIKGAMIYPISVITILIAVGIIVMVLIVPKLMTLFGDVDSLPKSTQILVGMSNFFIDYGIIAAIGFAVFTTMLKSYIKTPSGKYYWDLFKLHIPIFGRLGQKVAIARFTRSLAALSASGLNLIKALRINADAVGNEVYKKEILYTIDSVKKGITIHEDLAESKLFPQMVVNMIGIGEETAQLGHVSEKIADFYDDEIDNMIKNLSTLMEPVIIVVLGISVALLVYAIMQPIMQISEKAVALSPYLVI